VNILVCSHTHTQKFPSLGAYTHTDTEISVSRHIKLLLTPNRVRLAVKRKLAPNMELSYLNISKVSILSSKTREES
jgi:hypothetical protein